jgi:hypothetical protein
MKFTHSFLVYNLSYRIICYSRLWTAEYPLPITINISTEQISFWEANSLQLVKNFIVFHGHKKFITGFTSACKLFLFWAKLIFSIIRVIKTNLMYYLFSVYFVNHPLHVSGIFVAHHQEVYCIYTTIATCCAFQLTVCWPAGQQTDGRIEMHVQHNIKFNPTYLRPILIFSFYLGLGFLSGSFYFKFPHIKTLWNFLVFIFATWNDYLVFLLLVNLKFGLE